MPARLERRLRAGARKLHLRRGSKRWRAYVYGTLARVTRRRKRAPLMARKRFYLFGIGGPAWQRANARTLALVPGVHRVKPRKKRRRKGRR